jgi:signal transduction histidine kinase
VLSNGQTAGSGQSRAQVAEQSPRQSLLPESLTPDPQSDAQQLESPPLVELPTEVSPFQPVWMGEELLVVREVSVVGALSYQGVWLKADDLANYLLAAAADLLPNAELERIVEVSASSLPGSFEMSLDELSNDPLSLVTLPWRLQAGEAPVAAVVGWSALRISLAVGWVALILALLASAVLVRGVMKLSDRRATFVSAVTHELRTPLTTFHLYSDMLAEGMVKDEAKKKSYLTTMRREAERLNHLVENVLSYSRVERGSARTQHERISLEALVERMEPRLVERARKDNANLQVDSIEEADQVVLETDLTAVEQIVFNLVDNACKYGLPDEGERTVHLRATNGGRRARIEVCDEGGGIARADLKKLFRPFHKSAHDAAHSKPGVGLGLALCRRLARDLGGDLKIDVDRDEGACFILELPIVRQG